MIYSRLVRGIEEIKDLPDEQETMAKQTASHTTKRLREEETFKDKVDRLNTLIKM